MNRIAALVIVLAASFSVWPQADNTSQPNHDDILKRMVRESIVERDETLTHLVTFSLIMARAPGGVVFTPDADEEKRYKLIPSGFTLREVLDGIVALDDHYRWTVSDGVISLSGVEMSPPLLDTVIPAFNQENVNARTMIDELETLPEVQRQAMALGFTDIGGREYDGPLSTHTFSVHCKNRTLREVLDQIVRTHGRAVWSYKEYTTAGKKHFQLGLLFG